VPPPSPSDPSPPSAPPGPLAAGVDPRVVETYDARLAQHLVDPAEDLVDGVAGYLGLRIVEVGPGLAVGELDVRDDLVHRFGALHGGAVATLVDQVLGSAVYPAVPPGAWPATLEFKLSYLAAVRSGTVRATARCVSLRQHTAVVQVDVVNEGRMVAAALGTIAITPPRPDRA
jgi:uncharacterized protein (TIGR00369 family)